MGKGTKSGFKTFIILLIALIGAFILGCGAIMLLSPGVSIFGLKYMSHTGDVYIKEVSIDGVQQKIDIGDYDKVLIQTNYAHVNIAYGKENALQTNFCLKKSSSGFYKDGSRDAYSYSLTKEQIGEDIVLKFVLNEPDYSFIQITGSTVLSLNLSVNETDSVNKKIDVQTKYGNVFMGTGTSASELTVEYKANQANVVTEKGNITLSTYFDVENSLNLQTKSGKINIERNLSTQNISLNSDSGQINAKNFTNNTSSLMFKTEKSHIRVGEIAGDVYVDAKSGIFDAVLISGSLSAPSTIETVKFNISSVLGDIYLANEKGRFGVNIGKIGGNVNISTEGGSVKVGRLFGQTYIATKNAEIDVLVDKTNDKTIVISSTEGKIKVNFEQVLGSNTITSEKGEINVKCALASAFRLNASSEKGSIKKVWEDKVIKGEVISGEGIGSQPLEGNILNLASISGNISIDRY